MFSMRTCRCCKPITSFADSPSSPFKSEFGNQRDKYGRSVKLISWACSSRPCTPCYCCHPCVFCVIFVYCWQFISFVSVMGSAFCLMHGCHFVCWMLFLQPLNQAKLRTTSLFQDKKTSWIILFNICKSISSCVCLPGWRKTFQTQPKPKTSPLPVCSLKNQKVKIALNADIFLPQTLKPVKIRGYTSEFSGSTMETFNKILITHHHHSMSFHFTSGNLKAWFAHLFSYFHFHVGFICPGFEISASRISTSTLIVWRRMEFGLWFSHRNLITEKKSPVTVGHSQILL